MKFIYPHLFILFCFLFFQQNSIAQNSTRWKIKIDSANIFSSPRFTDLNQDGTKDVVVGAGVENNPSKNGILAINGKDGSILWKISTPTQIYTSALFQDITNDGVADVFIGGRAGCFYSINGATGEIIWKFWEGTTRQAYNNGILNFFATQMLDDQDKDGFKDILLTNGGDYLAPTSDKERSVANLMIISGKTGKVLHIAKMPEKRESYYAPHAHKKGRKTMIVLGTGGETINGGLWKVPLKKLKKGSIQKAKPVIRDSVKGYIINSVLADVNGDKKTDYITAGMNATISCIDGKKNKLLWQNSFEGFECYVTPSLGQFTDDEVPDVFTIIAEGTFPAYKSFRLLVIDGKTGEIVWQEDSGFNQFSPGISVDMNKDGIDEIIYVENKLIDPKTFAIANQLKVIDLVTKKSYFLGSIRDGISMASAPGIIDLEDNGKHEIVVATSSFEGENSLQYSIIECIDLDISCEKITWPGYLGPNENGLLNSK